MTVPSLSKFYHHLRYLSSDVRYPKPFVQFTGAPLGEHPEYPGVFFDINGFRNPKPPSTDKDPKIKRIFVVGDSTVVAGDCCADTICGKLAENLDRSLKFRVEIFNFGVTSSVLKQMNFLIWGELLELKPDFIVVLCGGTDMFSPWTYDPRPGFPYNFFAVERSYEILFSKVAIQAPPSEKSYEEMIEDIREYQNTTRKSVGWQSDVWARDILTQHFESLCQLKSISSAYRVNILAFLQPLVITRMNAPEHERSMLKDEFRSYLESQYQRLRSYYSGGKYHRHFSGYDLTDAFDTTREDIFIDFIHYNSLGRELIARRVASAFSLFVGHPIRKFSYFLNGGL